MTLPTSMDESFILEGVWWLHDKPDDVVSGRVRYEPGSPIVLSLIGIFGEVTAPFDLNGNLVTYRTIMGVTTDGKQVSLLRAVQSSRTFSMPGMATESYHGLWMIVGSHVDSIDCPAFQSSEVKFEQVESWLGRPSLSMHYAPNPAPIMMSITPYSEHVLGRIDRLGATVMSRMASHLHDDRFKKFEVEIRHSLAIQCDELQSAQWHAKTLEELSSLASLCTGRFLEISSIRLLTEEKEVASGVNHPEESFVFYQRRPVRARPKAQIVEPPIYSAAELVGDNPDAFARWMDIRGELKPSIDLLFTVLMSKSLQVEVAFLLMIQALEAFHRGTADDTVMGQAEYDILKDTLLSAIPPATPEDMKAKIKSSLDFGNEPSLRRRIKATIEPLKENFGSEPFGLRKKTIDDIVLSRNYYTHYPEDLRTHARSGVRLYELTERVKPLMFVLLLQRLGLKLPEIKEHLARRPDMKLVWD